MAFVQIITDQTTLSEKALFQRLESAAVYTQNARSKLSVQLRDPQLPVREKLRLGQKLRRLTLELGAQLVIGDRIDLALLLGADGVHLGGRSMGIQDARRLVGPNMFISCAAHRIQDVVDACSAGANAAFLSPIYPSPGKATPIGPEALASARALLNQRTIPFLLFALGGVDLQNAPICLASGAHGVAAIRADLLPCLEFEPPAQLGGAWTTHPQK
ncbi:MAG: thiamine phosphate synthase [Polyangiaceae bacterium]|nr:thiamine phosphate synthase [Polyangiaceae bacterium]